MRDISLEELLAAGCHFGHQVNRRNPKADEFIFEARSGVNIIDLGKTREGLLKAAEFVKKLSASGGNMVVVGTKRQAAPIVEAEAERARAAGGKNIYYITSRWIGGILTNFSEVSKNFKKLENIEHILSTDSKDYTKREKLLFAREKEKLLILYRGILGLTGTPSAIFIVDTHLENTAVSESRKMEVTLVGMTDTNSDPSVINYPIPANDDAVGSIQLIVSYITDAWIEGAAKGRDDREKADAKEKAQSEKATKDAAQTESDKAAKENLVKSTTEKKAVEVKKDKAVEPKKASKGQSGKATEQKTEKKTKKA